MLFLKTKLWVGFPALPVIVWATVCACNTFIFFLIIQSACDWRLCLMHSHFSASCYYMYTHTCIFAFSVTPWGRCALLYPRRRVYYWCHLLPSYIFGFSHYALSYLLYQSLPFHRIIPFHMHVLASAIFENCLASPVLSST